MQLKPWMVMVLLSILVVFIYHPVLWHSFVDMDDDVYFVKNEKVRAGLSMEGLQWAFSTFAAANWHPLTWLSLMLDATLFGIGPGGPHATNLVLHAVNALLVFAVFRSMTGTFWCSGLVAALFAVHPIHVESVAWVSERKDVLSTFFGLLALWNYSRFVRHRRGTTYLLVILFFSLSLLAKPMLVTLPFIFLLLDFWPLRRTEDRNGGGAQRPRNIPGLLLEKIPFILIAAGSSLVTVVAQRSGGAIQRLTEVTMIERLQNVVVAYAAYLGNAVAPVDLCAYYPLPNNGIPAGRVILALAILALITWGVFRSIRSRPYLAVGWSWFVGTMIPVIGLVQVGSQAMADRYAYIPFLGLYIMLAWGTADLVGRFPSIRRTIIGTWVIALCVLVMTASRQVHFWRDSVSLFGRALAVTENNTLMEGNYGMAIGRLGRHDEAIYHLSRSLLLWPDFFDARYNLGVALAAKGRLPEALEQYGRALAIDTASIEVHLNMGVTLAKLGRYEEAMPHLDRVLVDDPDNSAANVNVGMIYLRQQRIPEAIERLRTAALADPRSAEARNNLGLALEVSGRPEEAIPYYQEALRIAPSYTIARQNLIRAEQSAARAPGMAADTLSAE